MPPAVRRHSSSTDTIELDPSQMQAHLAEAAQLLKALGNEQRLHILCNLLEGPLSVGELNQRLELSQSALSQHLALLRESEGKLERLMRGIEMHQESFSSTVAVAEMLRRISARRTGLRAEMRAAE